MNRNDLVETVDDLCDLLEKVAEYHVLESHPDFDLIMDSVKSAQKQIEEFINEQK